jgi:hypothetical protein
MVLVKKKSICCKHSTCEKRASFHYKDQSKAMYCKIHKELNMINVRHKRCAIDGCEKRPIYNIPGTTITLFCNQHKEPDMIDVKSKRCALDGCETFAKNAKNRGYCMPCFIHVFPTEPVSRNYRTKEKAVVDFLRVHYPTCDWRHDRTIHCGTTKLRPDILLHLYHRVVIIEIDEFAHASYGEICEKNRMNTIYAENSFLPTVFIRFNPDKYIDSCGKKHRTCWTINKLGVYTISRNNQTEWDNRLNKLTETIHYYMHCVLEKNQTVVELFYDYIDEN